MLIFLSRHFNGKLNEELAYSQKYKSVRPPQLKMTLTHNTQKYHGKITHAYDA